MRFYPPPSLVFLALLGAEISGRAIYALFPSGARNSQMALNLKGYKARITLSLLTRSCDNAREAHSEKKPLEATQVIKYKPHNGDQRKVKQKGCWLLGGASIC